MKLYSPDDRMLPTQAHRDLWRWLPLQQVRAGRAMTTYCPGAISAPLEPLGDWKMSIGGVPLPE